MFLMNLPGSCGLAAHNLRANLSEFGPGNVGAGFKPAPTNRERTFVGATLGSPGYGLPTTCHFNASLDRSNLAYG
jgi:hypothetical protein